MRTSVLVIMGRGFEMGDGCAVGLELTRKLHGKRQDEVETTPLKATIGSLNFNLELASDRTGNFSETIE